MQTAKLAIYRTKDKINNDLFFQKRKLHLTENKWPACMNQTNILLVKLSITEEKSVTPFV